MVMPKLPKLPELTFPAYGVVEVALGAAFGIRESVRATGFRAMVANLKKLGCLGPQARVGRGTALAYTPLEIHRLLMTLEFCELGLPPATAVAIVEKYWAPKFWPIIERALVGVLHGGDDTILCLGGVGFRTASLRGAAAPDDVNIDSCAARELPARLGAWLGADTPNPPRALIVNLTARLRVFHRALADANLTDALDARGGEGRSQAGSQGHER
jgi:hypothetical protein